MKLVSLFTLVASPLFAECGAIRASKLMKQYHDTLDMDVQACGTGNMDVQIKRFWMDMIPGFESVFALVDACGTNYQWQFPPYNTELDGGKNIIQQCLPTSRYRFVIVEYNGFPFSFESNSPVEGVTIMVDGAEVWSSGTWDDDFGSNFEFGKCPSESAYEYSASVIF